MESITDMYDRLAEKYKFVLDKLDVIHSKLSQSSVDINKLKEFVEETIKEVALGFHH